MRSHATEKPMTKGKGKKWFQYRKRYEVTCDYKPHNQQHQYLLVSIPQAV